MTVRKKEPISRRPEIVRARVLDAAQMEFMEFGYAGASTNRILERFGGSKPTMFRHFPTKRALLEAVVERMARGLVDRINSDHINESSPGAWLSIFAKRTQQFLLGKDSLFLARLAISEGRELPETAAIYERTAARGIEETLIANLRRWTEEGLLNSPEPQTDAICFLDLVVSGLISRAMYRQQPVQDEELERHLARSLDIFLHGLQVRSA